MAESAAAAAASEVARARHTAGLQARAAGRFRVAAEAFLASLEAEPRWQPSYHALQFTRLSDADVAELQPRLRGVVERVPHLALAQQVLAFWQRRCGEEAAALQRSYHAAQLCCGPMHRPHLLAAAEPQLPEALILGAPKSGTTSLLAYLSRHPRIWAHPRKELHFFDSYWQWGEAWYRNQFPVFRPGSGIVRIEATPNYLQLPCGPERVATLMPEARLIVLLREPLERALSWFHHMQRQEGLQGEAARVLEQEADELAALSPEQRNALGWHHPNCLTGSLYPAQLQRWRHQFPADQLLVLRLEDLAADPPAVLARVLAFLGLPPLPWASEGQRGAWRVRHNAAPEAYGDLPADLSERLREGVLAEAHQLWRDLEHPPDADLKP
ncbi:sulfotransferase [Vulcanococcus limneticus Candia 3F8]|uniref:sulfotransferase domain-containing protein n=1 Tax=Vulcanococcus limneticus TaxID=2170428 RepID=UPI000B9996F6|nr:sulfotransferase domain-containing protein [Vulcanococcus limneticus]MCP9790343.1 sulfotransferase [Vulcanococcus limneticus MW73D5]MCP9892436.1 sulfotransferase [Vulcanococcus limneticus Candia 3F8]MCP9895742.1 sulfotransferase [Vulcanococcus limneticus Candia 3B3]